MASAEDSSALEQESATVEAEQPPAPPAAESEEAPAAESGEAAESTSTVVTSSTTTTTTTATTTSEEEVVTEYEREEVIEEKPRVVYPKGFTRYETMAVIRPNISEEGRTKVSQKYEELIIAGGGLDVEVFNRGIMPLGYRIIKKTTKGEKNAYMDGIYYMFTYATKPAQVKATQRKMETDDDLIRVMTLKM